MMLSIVIPAYNEERTITALLERVLALDLSPDTKEVIVVDDGSRDKTPEILANLPRESFMEETFSRA